MILLYYNDVAESLPDDVVSIDILITEVSLNRYKMAQQRSKHKSLYFVIAIFQEIIYGKKHVNSSGYPYPLCYRDTCYGKTLRDNRVFFLYPI